MNIFQTEIKNVANFINGYPFKPTDWETSGFRIIRIQNLTDPNKPYNLTTLKVPDKYIVRKGDILVSWSATIDVFEWEEDDSYLNQHIFKVEFDESKVAKSYFKVALKKTINDLIKFAHGSTMKHVVKGDFDNHKIPLPPLDDQIRIADVLTRAEKLIAKRKESIKALDEFLKSTFLEMFGDPVRNEKGFNLIPLSNFIVHLTSGGRGWSKFYSDQGDRFIRSLDVRMNHISMEDAVFVKPTIGKETERTKVNDGDVLLTITGSCIGRVAYVPSNFGVAYVSQHVAIIRTKEINPIYLSYYLSMPNAGQLYIKKQQYGQTKPGLNLNQVQSSPIIFSPLQLQNKFAAIVEKVEAMKVKYNESLVEMEKLYGSLSQRAFRGEL